MKLTDPKRPNKILWITLFLIVALSGILAALFVLNKNTVLKKPDQPKTNITIPTPTSNSPRYQPPQVKNWYLEKKTSNGVETIINLPELGNNQIVRWGDYIFYGSGNYTSNVQVFSFNLKTDETKTIYDLKSRNDFGIGSKDRYISDMQVLNKTLFFSVGGYLMSGATFYVPLPPSNPPLKLADSANGKIVFMKNRYWIISGEGDSCWGTTHYSLLDLMTKQVTDVATSNVGCIEGEEYVDIDKRDRMILAFHTSDTGFSSKESNGIYQYVIAVPLSNPAIKEGVIAKQNMPSGITSVSYIQDKDQLILSGEENYLFDFSSQSLVKTSETPKPSHAAIPLQPDKSFSDKVKELNLPSEYEFVLK